MLVVDVVVVVVLDPVFVLVLVLALALVFVFVFVFDAVVEPAPAAVVLPVVLPVFEVVDVVSVVDVVVEPEVEDEALVVELTVPADAAGVSRPPNTPKPHNMPKANIIRPNKPRSAQHHFGHLSFEDSAAIGAAFTEVLAAGGTYEVYSTFAGGI